MVDRRPAPQPHLSWATNEPTPGPGLRRVLRRHFDRVSMLDVLIALAVVALFDLVAVLLVSGWQSARCGELCGLRTQLHLMHIAAVLTFVVIILPPALIAILTRRGRAVVLAVQAVLCLGLLLNTIGTQHRLTARLHGTATCWNPGYSNADCPWGPKD